MKTTAAAPNVVALQHKCTRQQLRRKILLMLATHIQNFQRTIFMNRRRMQQRIRRRQAALRSFYVQQLLDLESSFMEMLPLPGLLELRSSTQQNDHTNALNNVSTMPPEPNGLFEHAVRSFNDSQWLDAFRVRQPTFQRICEQLRGVLTSRQDSEMGMSREKRIAVALYTLASGDSARVVALLFHVHVADVQRCVRRFAEVLMLSLGKSLIAMPRDRQECRDISTAFYKASNMPPAIVGIAGVCQIPCETQGATPTAANHIASAEDDDGIVLQAIIDDRLLFRKVHLHSRVPSLLLDSANEVNRLEPHMINGRLVSAFVLCPPAYGPMRPWLLHRYEDPIAPHEYDFNEAVDNLALFKEQAFCRLIARWRFLRRADCVVLDTLILRQITLACCALHNLLEEMEEGYSERWEADTDAAEFEVAPQFDEPDGVGQARSDTAAAMELRDFLARTISSTEM